VLWYKYISMGGRGGGHLRLTAEEPELKPDSEHHGGSFKNYMIVKNRHLHEQYEQQVKNIKAAGACSDIFNGVSIHVNGYTNPTHQVCRAPIHSLSAGALHII
jgi:hypothetical protein